MDFKQHYTEVAYRHFAEFGPDQFTFSKIAGVSGIAHSTLRKHFGSVNNLMDCTLEKHYQEVEIFNEVCKKQCKIYSDIHKFLLQCSTGFKFHIQLYKNKDFDLYNLVYNEAMLLTKDHLVPLFMAFYDYEMPLISAEIMWLSLVDSWYSKLDIDNIHLESLLKTNDEIMHIMLSFKNSLN